VTLAARHLDFTVTETDDHNFVVRFSESAFAVVFAREFAEAHAEIERHAHIAGAQEVLLGKAAAPREHLLIGLYARTRLLEDLKEPVLVRSVAPSSTGAAPRKH